MKTGKLWWVFIGLVFIWTLPTLYASAQILLSIANWHSIAEFYQPLLGTIALVLSGLMPFFFLLPTLLTDFTEDFIRQRGLFVRKEINWSDIISLHINEHREVIISSHREHIKFSLYLCKSPKDELTNILSLSAVQKAKEKMDGENRFYLEKLQSDLLNQGCPYTFAEAPKTTLHPQNSDAEIRKDWIISLVAGAVAVTYGIYSANYFLIFIVVVVLLYQVFFYIQNNQK